MMAADKAISRRWARLLGPCVVGLPSVIAPVVACDGFRNTVQLLTVAVIVTRAKASCIDFLGLQGLQSRQFLQGVVPA